MTRSNTLLLDVSTTTGTTQPPNGSTCTSMYAYNAYATINASNTNPTLGEQVTFTGQYLAAALQNGVDKPTYPVPNCALRFYLDGQTLIGSATTDGGGNYSFTWVAGLTGTHSVGVAAYLQNPPGTSTAGLPGWSQIASVDVNVSPYTPSDAPTGISVGNITGEFYYNSGFDYGARIQATITVNPPLSTTVNVLSIYKGCSGYVTTQPTPVTITDGTGTYTLTLPGVTAVYEVTVVAYYVEPVVLPCAVEVYLVSGEGSALGPGGSCP